jgi:hypothetical protein
VAETLGTAELILTVNDTALRQGLKDARAEIESLQSTANRTTTRSRRTQNSTAGGSSSSSNRRETKAERDLEVLKEKRFRLARRIDSLEERGVSTTRLRTQLGRLTTAYADREFTTARRISQELARQVTLSEAKDRTARRTARESKAQADANVRSARGLDRINLEGSQREVGSPVFSARGVSRGGARESINAITDAQKRRYKLDQQIRSLEANGVKTTKLRTQLGEATTAQARRQFGSFNQIADSLEFTLRKERDRLRVSRDQAREIERQATAGLRVGRLNASPVRGGIAFPGSPGALAAQQAEGRRIGRLNTSPVQGGTGFPGSPGAIRAEERLAAARERSAKAAEKSIESEGRRIGKLNTSPVKGGPAFPGSPGEAEALAKAEELLTKNRERSRKAAESKARAEDREGRRIGKLNASPVQGGTAFPGSPAAVKAAIRAEKELEIQREKTANATVEAFRKERGASPKGSGGSSRFKDALGSGIIGGAFPALFGQGAGASLGGGLGGIAGGLAGGNLGFGLSLVGTQIGQFVDDAINKTKTLVQAFKDPIASFDALKEAALLSSKGLETNIDSLIKAGREEEAAALIRQDLSKSFGNGEEFKQLATAYDSVSRNLTKLGVSIVDGLAPALIVGANAVADFIDKLSGNKLKKAGDDVQQAKAFIGNDPSRQAEFDKLFKGLGGKYAKNGLFEFDSTGAGVEASRQLLANNKQLTKVQQLQADETAQVGEAYQRFIALRKTETALIAASFTGDKLRTNELEKQKLALEEARALKLAPAGDDTRADQIRNEYADKRLRLDLQRRDVLRSIAALEDQASISQQSLRLSGSGTSALQAGASLRDARRAYEDAQKADPTGDLKEAAQVFATTSAAASTQLVEAFRSAKREAFDAASALSDAYTSLLSLRNGNDGIRKYLDRTSQSQLDQNNFNQTKPLFDAAKERAAQRLEKDGISGDSIRNLNFVGSLQDVTKAMLKFIDVANADSNAQEAVVRAQEAVVIANNSLVTATYELAGNNIKLNETLILAATATQELAKKDWNIYVNVPGADKSGRNFINSLNSRS